MAEEGALLIHRIEALHSMRSAKKLSSTVFGGLRSVVHLVRGCKVMLTKNVAYRFGLANGSQGRFVGAVYAASARVGDFPEALVLEVPEYCGPPFYKGSPKWVPILPCSCTKEGTRVTRTQSPVVAGFALTVNKAPGVTIEEGVAIHLNGSENNRPALAGGMPYVAFTRSESFHMTAFCNPPPWGGFVRGSRSNLLRMRRESGESSEGMHRRAIAKCPQLSTEEDEDTAYEDGLVEQARGSSKKRKQERHGVPALSVMLPGGGTVVDGRHWPSALTLLGVGPEVPATCETVY